jgi:hypothetical protein
MTQEQLIRRAAQSVYMQNGSVDGHAKEDWAQAKQLVQDNWGNGNRCVSAFNRSGKLIIVEISPGHSSYQRAAVL